MRTIKFRGFSIEKQKWVYGNLVEKDHPQIEQPTIWVRLIHDRALHEEPVISQWIGQYTGWNDMNGTEIFEHDILLIEDYEFVEYYDCGIPDSPGERYKDCHCVVTYSGTGFVVNAWNGMGEIPLDYFEPKHIKVIGNMQQHEHLMPKEAEF